MAKDDKGGEEVDGVIREREGKRPDFSTPPPRKKLPKELQDTLDNEEKMWEVMYEGSGEDSVDTNVRYAAYASRLRTIMQSAHRYVAYSSDIGESFRPVAHPYLVRTAYGISWAYIAGDVAHEGWKAYLRNQRVLHPEYKLSEKGSVTDQLKELKDAVTSTEGVKTSNPKTGEEANARKVPAIEDYRAVMAQRAVFQSIASMGLPALLIHSIVKYSGRAMKDVKNKRLRTWGPIGLGIAAVPFLPYIFDEPVEHATEWVFYNAFKFFGGPEAVEGRPVTGQKELRKAESHVRGSQEREL
ncbi:hypothetical protein DM02DRAFT_669080 [Periconia macrospinosa]|uniref:Mitochondrial fission process protein 1 n=1 Tax=Periconia macrospinosa TaxID=97972 RepID=A0A2V1E478_9PLEO|nr:hypothetical protein DM02DRAFT_669080 [Periconia macrospinosa]